MLSLFDLFLSSCFVSVFSRFRLLFTFHFSCCFVPFFMTFPFTVYFCFQTLIYVVFSHCLLLFLVAVLMSQSFSFTVSLFLVILWCSFISHFQSLLAFVVGCCFVIVSKLLNQNCLITYRKRLVFYIAMMCCCFQPLAVTACFCLWSFCLCFQLFSVSGYSFQPFSVTLYVCFG